MGEENQLVNFQSVQVYQMVKAVYHLCTQDNEKIGRPYFLSTLHFCRKSDIHPLFLIFVEDMSPHLNIVEVGGELEYKMAERLI